MDESELVGTQGTHRGAEEKWRKQKVLKGRHHTLGVQPRREDFHQGGLRHASWRKQQLGWILRYRYDVDMSRLGKAF